MREDVHTRVHTHTPTNTHCYCAYNTLSFCFVMTCYDTTFAFDRREYTLVRDKKTSSVATLAGWSRYSWVRYWRFQSSPPKDQPLLFLEELSSALTRRVSLSMPHFDLRHLRSVGHRLRCCCLCCCQHWRGNVA